MFGQLPGMDVVAIVMFRGYTKFMVLTIKIQKPNKRAAVVEASGRSLACP